MPDPWSADVPPMSPALERMMRFHHIIEYDRVATERKKLEEDKLGAKASDKEE